MTQDRPDVAAARAELKADQPKLKTPRLVFIDETSVTTKMVRQYGRAPLGERLVAHRQGELTPHRHEQGARRRIATPSAIH